MDERRCVDQALRYLPLQARLECSAMRQWTVVALEWRCPSREPRTSTAGRACILTVSVKRCRTSQALRYVIDSIHASICFGTSPSQAPKSRPLENAAPLPIAATVALEMIGPMPGTVI